MLDDQVMDTALSALSRFVEPQSRVLVLRIAFPLFV